jgi:hypothetical protein
VTWANREDRLVCCNRRKVALIRSFQPFLLPLPPGPPATRSPDPLGPRRLGRSPQHDRPSLTRWSGRPGTNFMRQLSMSDEFRHASVCVIQT